MRFTLYYRGELKANAKPDAKHRLRQYFHQQLRNCWNEMPLNDFHVFLANPPGPSKPSVLMKRHGFTFAPLVSESLGLVAELDILMLWPQPPGAIVSGGGDIDNRLKTLFDALKVPSEPTALPSGAAPSVEEVPFFCLLEDDRLITRVSIETDRFLEPVTTQAEVALFLRVGTRQIRIPWGMVGFP